MTQQEDMNKRFDERFVVKSNAGTDLLRYTDANLIKSFIQSEIALAVAEERKRIKSIISNHREVFLTEKQNLEFAISDIDDALNQLTTEISKDK